MKRIMSICVILCSFVLLSGCVNMTQNNEIKETLEKAFNTAQGNDLFEVGKQVLDTYAPKEESIYIVNTYFKGTMKENDTKELMKIYLVIKYERNQSKLKVKLLKRDIGQEEPIKILDLIYYGRGQYYTLSGELHEPFKDFQLLFENKKDILFQELVNQKYRKNEGNVYGLTFDKLNQNFIEKESNKIEKLLLVDGSEKVRTEEGGISFWNHKSNDNLKQDFNISMTVRSVALNTTVSSSITLSVHEIFNID